MTLVKVLEVLVTEALVLAVWNQQVSGVSGGSTARFKLSPTAKETKLSRSSMRQCAGSRVSPQLPCCLFKCKIFL